MAKTSESSTSCPRAYAVPLTIPDIIQFRIHYFCHLNMDWMVYDVYGNTRFDPIWDVTEEKVHFPQLQSCIRQLGTLQLHKIQNENLPNTYHEFHRRWCGQGVTEEQRYRLLVDLGLTRLQKLFEGEMNFGILGELLQILGAFTMTVDDMVFAVRLLEIVTETKRFSLALQFLSASEKNKCNELFQLFRNELNQNQQDLAERGITEWTLQTLATKYTASC